MAEAKSRHGCLTAWLILMIVGNTLTALIYIFRGEAIEKSFPNAAEWESIVRIILSMFNLVCAIALFKWKKWGFWGFCLSSVVALVLNLYIGVGLGISLSGLVGVALSYGVLQIGKNNKGWPQLD